MKSKYIESELQGKTLRVYWYLLQHYERMVGSTREIQRALGFSSPNLVSYHLEKLSELGLLEKKQGKYAIAREIKVGALRQFARVGTFMFPRYLFYAAFFSTMLSLYVVFMNSFSGNINIVFVLIFGVIGAAVSWFETLSLWRQKK